MIQVEVCGMKIAMYLCIYICNIEWYKAHLKITKTIRYSGWNSRNYIRTEGDSDCRDLNLLVKV